MARTCNPACGRQRQEGQESSHLRLQDRRRASLSSGRSHYKPTEDRTTKRKNLTLFRIPQSNWLSVMKKGLLTEHSELLLRSNTGMEHGLCCPVPPQRTSGAIWSQIMKIHRAQTHGHHCRGTRRNVVPGVFTATQQTCQKANSDGCQPPPLFQISFLIPKGPEGENESQAENMKCLHGRRLQGHSLGLPSRFRGGWRGSRL